MIIKKGIQIIMLLLIAIPIFWWLNQVQKNRPHITFLSLESARSKPADQIKILDLRNSNLQRFPDQLAHYKALESLNMDGYLSVRTQVVLNDIYTSYVYASLEDSIQIAHYNKQTKGNQIDFLPTAIGQFNSLKYLFIRNNRLTTLPNDIGQLSLLKELHLSGNQLSNFPNTIQQLQQLEKLDLASNQLRNLPPNLSLLKKLKELDLSNNQLSTFLTKANKHHLVELEQLSLNDNQFTTFPLYLLTSVPQLTSLEMQHNQLHALPQNLSSLRQLDWLDLRANNFSQTEKRRIKKALPRTSVSF